MDHWLRSADLERRWTEGQRQQFSVLLQQVRELQPQVPIIVNNTAINTGGGAYVGGNVQVGQNFVGRDQQGDQA